MEPTTQQSLCTKKGHEWDSPIVGCLITGKPGRGSKEWDTIASNKTTCYLDSAAFHRNEGRTIGLQPLQLFICALIMLMTTRRKKEESYLIASEWIPEKDYPTLHKLALVCILQYKRESNRPLGSINLEIESRLMMR
jgi:hypothetical protein